VASIALDAEGGRDKLHRRHQLVGGDAFELRYILEDLFSRFYFRSLREDRQSQSSQNNERSHCSTLARDRFPGLAQRGFG
jgi:hypothetical protein